MLVRLCSTAIGYICKKMELRGDEHAVCPRAARGQSYERTKRRDDHARVGGCRRTCRGSAGGRDRLADLTTNERSLSKRDRTVIARHPHSVFSSGELAEEGYVQERHFPNSDETSHDS